MWIINDTGGWGIRLGIRRYDIQSQNHERRTWTRSGGGGSDVEQELKKIGIGG
jgi:hypothetical protein